jgi:hypothetical protein
MNVLSLDQRAIAKLTCLAFLCSLLALPGNAFAAGNARYELRPHCDKDNELASTFGGPLPDSKHLAALTDGQCPGFEVRDPQNLQTPVLNPGDTLDMDLVIHNPDKKPISRYRAWISYDASSLNGIEVIPSSDFPIPTPGENTFSPAEGFLKVSGTSGEPINDEKIVVARIRMQVSNPRFDGAPLAYFDLSDTVESRTGVFEKSGASESNVLSTNPGFLFVRFNVQGSSTSSMSQASSTMSAASMSSISSITGATSGVFTMLQVQGLRLTTEGSSVFLAWDALPSGDLVGYNVYYGTTSGRYIQRRGVDKAATSLTIRALPVGTTYYFAVRGVNGAGQETEFSQEVGVSVGNPRTSTSPLAANSIPGNTPSTNGTVSGETGASSVLLVFLTLSAIVGTVIAFRRQLNA